MEFVSESFDIDGEVVSTFWDFGEGSTAEGVIVHHNYTSPGIYYGKLVVTDDSYDTSTENIEIIISETEDNTIFPFMTISTVIIIAAAYLFRKPWLKIISSL
jgi:PKD repeat protein